MRRVLVAVAVAALAALAAAQQVFAAPAAAAVQQVFATPPAAAAQQVVAAPAAAASVSMAIVVRDQTALRAAPHESAQQQALLWQGELVEVRGERIDHLQVWDYRRERGGFVDASRVRRTSLAAADAAELMAVLRFVRETPGSEALGFGLAAAYLRAASVEAVQGAAGAEAFDAIGTMADRLAQRASGGAAAASVASGTVAGVPIGAPNRTETALAAHLEVAAHYGVAFKSIERDGAMRICYDGEAFRRVLAMPSASAAQRARAGLGVTRLDCIDPALPVTERQRVDRWSAEVLDRVDATRLPKNWQSRVAMRRASVWSGLAFQHARRGEAVSAEAAAKRALAELAAVSASELADDDVAGWNEAAIRVGASRWAATPLVANTARNVRVVTTPGEPGQTCVSLVDGSKPETGTWLATAGANGPLAKADANVSLTGAGAHVPLAKPGANVALATRCTYGVVWGGSTVLNREGNALALAVQPMPAWRELWLFTREAGGNWSVQVLPPSTAAPELGYAEFAGWVPGGKQMLVAREARGPRGLKRNFEVVRLDTLGTDRQASDPAVLGAFQRWQDAAWKSATVSIR